MSTTTRVLAICLAWAALLSAAGCAGPRPFVPKDKVFGSPGEGGLLLFAAQGQYEIWRTNQDITPTDAYVTAAGNLGDEMRLVGLAIGRRYVTALSQRADGQLGLHRLAAGALDPAPILLSRQPVGPGWKARSFALYLGNPNFCLEGESDHLLLLERPAAGNLLDEVWLVSETGLVRQQMTFERPSGWLPVAAGIGAVESPHPWILFARPDGLQAKLVHTRPSASGNELLLMALEVPFVTLGTPLTGRPAASGFGFATTVRDNERQPGSYLYWWHIYKWRETSPPRNTFVISPEPGGSGYPPARLALAIGDSPPGLDLVAYADRRPACIVWKSIPKPESLSRQEELFRAYDGVLQPQNP